MRLSTVVLLLSMFGCASTPSERTAGRPGAGLTGRTAPIGNIVITEIMRNPAAVSDSRGEWFELTNTTGATIDLAGVEVSDSSGSGFTIDQSLLVSAGASVVLGRNGDVDLNGGVALDFDWPGSFSLGNGSDDLFLHLGGSLLDSVAWDGGGSFPGEAGAAMALDADTTDAEDNDDGAAWCAASTVLSSGDRGTPGAANPACDGGTAVVSVHDVAVGDLVITEIMQNPAAVRDSDGEWLELHNTGALPIELMGLEVADSDGRSFTVDTSVVVDAGGYVVLGQSDDVDRNGGAPVDFAWSGTFSLGNGDDDIQLHNAVGLLDAVAWDESYVWGDPSGASLSLDPSVVDVDANDVGGVWCEATATFGDGDRGTPGAANPVCPLDQDGDGYTIADGDCDDDDEDKSPGNVELCDGMDNDCDGAGDSAVPGDYYTLSFALTQVADGELICLGAGTFEGPFVVDGKGVTLQGAGVDQTTLTGDAAGRVVSFVHGTDARSGLSDLTVEGGRAEQGAGLFIDHASPVLRDIAVRANDCEGELDCEGAGVWMRSSEASFTRVEFDSNRMLAYDAWTTPRTWTGGVVYMESSSPTFTDVTFTGGMVSSATTAGLDSSVRGGVVAVLDGSTPVFENVSVRDTWVVQDRSAGGDLDGGIFYVAGDSRVALSHVEVFDSMWSGDVLRGGLAYVADGSGLTLTHGVVANNNVYGSANEIWGGLLFVGADTGTVDLESMTVYANDIGVASGGRSHADGVYVDCSEAGSTDVRLSHLTLQSNGDAWAWVRPDFFGSTGSHCADNVELEYVNDYDNGGWTGLSPATTVGYSAVDSDFRSVWTTSSAADWDLTLATLSALSDAGDPTRLDADGSRMDIGAYGGEAGDGW